MNSLATTQPIVIGPGVEPRGGLDFRLTGQDRPSLDILIFRKDQS